MANCITCAGPLPAGSTICVYCGTRNDVDLRGVHEYTVRVPESPRQCPRCAVRMRTIDVHADRKFLIEQCATCNGLFFDPNELEALLDTTVKHAYTIDFERIETLVGEPASREEVCYRKCPVCAELMHRYALGARSGVVLDRCAPHGVWLDGGELRRLMEWRKAGGQLLHEKLEAERKTRERSARAARAPVLPVSVEERKAESGIDLVEILGTVWSFAKRFL